MNTRTRSHERRETGSSGGGPMAGGVGDARPGPRVASTNHVTQGAVLAGGSCGRPGKALTAHRTSATAPGTASAVSTKRPPRRWIWNIGLARSTPGGEQAAVRAWRFSARPRTPPPARARRRAGTALQGVDEATSRCRPRAGWGGRALMRRGRKAGRHVARAGGVARRRSASRNAEQSVEKSTAAGWRSRPRSRRSVARASTACRGCVRISAEQVVRPFWARAATVDR